MERRVGGFFLPFFGFWLVFLAPPSGVFGPPFPFPFPKAFLNAPPTPGIDPSAEAIVPASAVPARRDAKRGALIIITAITMTIIVIKSKPKSIFFPPPKDATNGEASWLSYCYYCYCYYPLPWLLHIIIVCIITLKETYKFWLKAPSRL
uniref:Wsv460 n=1 Tax=White spot syndrome virus TaxID=92652 RepID=A0A2U9GH16_WSSV|nr:wsv460 [Shrimp white spot syndrome virus]AWQ63932.1 wsv460 [Shrimp white spot syndrome virus]